MFMSRISIASGKSERTTLHCGNSCAKQIPPMPQPAPSSIILVSWAVKRRVLMKVASSTLERSAHFVRKAASAMPASLVE
jgi:hypothetical protein